MRQIDRREALVGIAAVLIAPASLLACGKKQLACTDTSGLSADETAMRTTLSYVDQTPDPSKACSGCQLYKPAGEGQCGGCGVIKGPVNPDGTCKSWVKKA